MAKESIQAGVSCIVMNEKDNVATLLRDTAEGEQITYNLENREYTVTLQEPIKFGHKIAVAVIPAGEPVIKYGESIGAATRTIAAGEHVHVHNIEGIRGRGDRILENGGNEN
ncbi:UxaA family hydrolase [Peribacillus kribbensis]|uniref:UxaA family hydrolase n=1 Tax=Peribacillus kribbensis TaxID=356658 RepID=UPI000478B0C1|nr:UxaA family hydrolase [Peribacillus kribbensis]